MHIQGVKLQRRVLVQSTARQRPSALLYLHDSCSNTRFLIDTGVDVCIISATTYLRTLPPILHPYAANWTKIPVYTRHTVQLNLYLRRSFEWTFYVGKVSKAIIGADFLKHFNLLVDVKGQKLVDPLTPISSTARPALGDSTHLVIIYKDHQLSALFKSFPTLIQPYVKHNVTHHIETTGPPVHAKARCLAPERYR